MLHTNRYKPNKQCNVKKGTTRMDSGYICEIGIRNESTSTCLLGYNENVWELHSNFIWEYHFNEAVFLETFCIQLFKCQNPKPRKVFQLKLFVENNCLQLMQIAGELTYMKDSLVSDRFWIGFEMKPQPLIKITLFGL